MRTLGSVESIGVSGRVWAGFHAVNLAGMLFEELRHANKTIQMCSFAAGYESPVMDKLFMILEEQLKNPPMKISVIINDDVMGKTVTPYFRKRIGALQARFPDQFFPQYFGPRTTKDANRILHAKITVIDGHTALIGSANLSKGALESNYEVMLKVSGQVAADLSSMLSRLSAQMRQGRA